MLLAKRSEIIGLAITSFFWLWPLHSARAGTYAVIATGFIISLAALSLSQKKIKAPTEIIFLVILLLTHAAIYIAIFIGQGDDIEHAAKIIYFISPAICILALYKFRNYIQPISISKQVLYIGLALQALMVLVIAGLETSGGKIFHESFLFRFSSNELSYYFTLGIIPFAVYLRKENQLSRIVFGTIIALSLIHLSKGHLLSLCIAFGATVIVEKKLTIAKTIAFLTLLLLAFGTYDQWDENKQLRTIKLAINEATSTGYHLSPSERVIEAFENIADNGRQSMYRDMLRQVPTQGALLGLGNTAEEQVNHGRDFHNAYLGIYFELGALGLLVFLLQILTLFFIANRCGSLRGVAYFCLIYFLLRSGFSTMDHGKISFLIALIYLLELNKSITPKLMANREKI